MEWTILHRSKFLRVIIKENEILFEFRTPLWWADIHCPYAAAAVFQRSVYKNRKEIMDMKIKDYMKYYDEESFIFYLTGGIHFWYYKSKIPYSFVKNELVEDENIRRIIDRVKEAETMKDAVKIIDRHVKSISMVKYRYLKDEYKKAKYNEQQLQINICQ